MRIKLSVKFFLAFLMTSLTIIALVVVIGGWYADRAFSEYVHKMEVLQLDELTVVLTEEYRENNGWEQLKNNSSRWWYLLRPHLSVKNK